MVFVLDWFGLNEVEILNWIWIWIWVRLRVFGAHVYVSVCNVGSGSWREC